MELNEVLLTTPPSSLSHNLDKLQQLGCNFNINSTKLDKFTGNSSVHPQTWWDQFQNCIDLYEVPNDKVVKVIAFQLSDEAAMNISQPELMKTDSFTARNNNTPHIGSLFEPRQSNRPNNRSNKYYNQNSRPQMQSFPRPQNQNTYQPSDRCGFCGMDRYTRNVCPARDKIC